MNRRLSELTCIISSLLCVLLLAVWVRSQFVFDDLSWTSATANSSWVPGHPTAKLVKATTAHDMTRRLNVLSSNGCIGVGRHYAGAASKGDGPLNKNSGLRWKRETEAPTNLWGITDHWIERLGFYNHLAQWRIWDGPLENRYSGQMWLLDDRVIVVPYWFLVTLSGVLPTWWIVTTLRQRRRAAQNCCTTCGYDLRATPERCPECGTISGKTPVHST